VLAAPLPESVREPEKVFFIDRTQYRSHGLLHDLILNRGNTQRSLPPIGFGNVYPSRWPRPISSGVNLPVQVREPIPENFLVFFPRHSVHASRSLPLESIEALHQHFRRDVMQQRREPQPPFPAGCFAYTFKARRRTTGPALRPGCGVLVGVPFGYAPSLRHLRRFNPFVRWLQRYYGRIRLLIRVGGGIAVIHLPRPARP
jgi:hypothetical protein